MLGKRLSKANQLAKKRQNYFYDKEMDFLFGCGKQRLGSFRKWNGNCGCKQCKYYKHIGNSSGKRKFNEIKKLKETEEQIKEYEKNINS